jgi:peptide chain release factor 2
MDNKKDTANNSLNRNDTVGKSQKQDSIKSNFSLADSNELIRNYKSLLDKIGNRMKSLKIDESRKRLEELVSMMSDAGFWDDHKKASNINQEKVKLERKITPWDSLYNNARDNSELSEMALEEKDVEAIRSLHASYQELADDFDKMELMGILNEPEDSYNAFLNIHPGAGGTESMDWADMLYRMYLRWFEKKGWKYELIDYLPGEQAGVKNATLLVRGHNAFGLLKSENGIHRLVRLSPFDSANRRHTSFVSIHVSPELPEDNVTLEINESDIRIDTFRSSGAGGQHVNTTDSAIRITHFPSGIVVQCQNERSQIKNRSTAMKILKSRLLVIEREKKATEAQEKSGEKKDIGWGSQIRSYVFHPYNMVKDHRTNHETGNVEGVMNGNLDPFIFAYLKNIG